jgi:hypothetical protein
MARRAIQVSAELRRENGFRCLTFPIWTVSPARKLVRDKRKQMAQRGRRQMYVSVEGAGLRADDWEIGEHE